MRDWSREESLWLGMIISWFFFAGYMAALCGAFGLAWSTWSVTLHFPSDGPMTGPLFVQLLNIARWVFIVLTVILLVYTAYFTTLSLKLKEALRKQGDRRVTEGC